MQEHQDASIDLYSKDNVFVILALQEMVEQCATVNMKYPWSHFFRLLQIECGITYTPPTARIIGGMNTIEHSWPFAVLIRQRYKRTVTLDGTSYLVRLE